MIALADKIRKALGVSADSQVLINIESGGLVDGGTLTKLWVQFPESRINELKTDNFKWLDELKGWNIPTILFGADCNLELDDVDYIDGGLKLHYFQKPVKKNQKQQEARQ